MVLGQVLLYAARVKLYAMSNAPGPRPSHQGPGVLRGTFKFNIGRAQDVAVRARGTINDTSEENIAIF